MPIEVEHALGDLNEAVGARLEAWDTNGISGRIWAKDPTVWAETDLPELTDRLGWLTLPDDMGGEVPELQAFADEIRDEGVAHVVLLGMGGSSLAPEVFQATFGNAPGRPELIVLDSTHPDAVLAVDNQIDLERTLFVVASKSGSTLETLSFMRYFWHRLATSGLSQGERFVALTDPESDLEAIAAERGFRRVFSTPPEVGGRYSALTSFGLVPAALIGVDIAALLMSAATAAAACHNSATHNPGLTLGAVWGEAALAGKDKLTIITSPGLASFPDWLEQLIAESTGKHGTGIVPVVGESLGEPGDYGADRLFLAYQLAADPPLDVEALSAEGHPVTRVTIERTEDLGGAMFHAEMATAGAGAVLGIHPFNQPDVQIAKELARKAMAGELEGGAPIVEASPTDGQAIRQWLAGRPEDAYLGLAAFIPMTAASVRLTQDLRHQLGRLAGSATTVGFGPRFLHSTGQLHKGGPAAALFLQLVDEPQAGLAVPETDFTFDHLVAGQALGDYRALEERRRKILRVQLGPDPIEGLERLLDTVSAID